MDRKRIAVLGAVSVVLLVVVWLLFFRAGDDEQSIRAQIARFVRAVHVDAQENVIARRGRIQGEFDDVLTKEVALDVPELASPSSGRSALVDVASQAAMVWVSADIDTSDVHVTIAPSKKSATVTATAALVGTRRDGGGEERDRRDVTFELRVEDGWRISAIHVSARRE